MDGRGGAFGADGAIPVELCFGSSWQHPGDLFNARFVVLPRTGELIELPHRTPGCYKVVEVRHRTATPSGEKARVQLLVRPSVPAR